jgi:hypothetical protein
VFEVLIAQAIISGLMMLMAFLLGYWAQDRSPPVTIKKVEVGDIAIPPGETLRVRYTVHRHRSCHVHLEQVIYDGDRTRIAVPDEDFTASPGDIGEDMFSLAIPIPHSARPGEGVYRGIRSYFCNPLQTWFDWPIVVLTPPTRFTILKKPEAADSTSP